VLLESIVQLFEIQYSNRIYEIRGKKRCIGLENLFSRICICSSELIFLKRTRKYERYNGRVDIDVRWRAW